MNTVNKALPLLVLFHGLSSYHQKKYCYPSQLKIMELLQSRQGLKISIATLNRYLKAVEEAGFIRRIRRIRRDPRKGTVFQSTIYQIKYAGYMLLSKVGVPCWTKFKELFFNKRTKPPKSLTPTGQEDKQQQNLTIQQLRARHPNIKLPWDHHTHV